MMKPPDLFPAQYMLYRGNRMSTEKELIRKTENGDYDEKFRWLYCLTEEDTGKERERYIHVLSGLLSHYGEHPDTALFSAPGRTEIGGNHTDHQHGAVLCASVNTDMIAAAGKNGTDTIRLLSEGYGEVLIATDDLSVREGEKNTTASLVRGICHAFSERGACVSGLDIYMTSAVPKGSGVSSSAAFEVLMANIFSAFFCDEGTAPDAVEIAKIGQYAENVYFGKPSGLMDQMASSVGGAVYIDFHDPDAPLSESLELNLSEAGLSLCIVDSGADHADLTGEYAAVPEECREVASLLGASVLGEIPYTVFMENLPRLRGNCPDRALLRAIHFYDDTERARKEAEALRKKDYDTFLSLVNASGDSSFEYLQNITPAGSIRHQDVALTIAILRKALRGKGAVRVHGGGFAGTVQAFVPLSELSRFMEFTERVTGPGSCHVMSVRPAGGIRIDS